MWKPEMLDVFLDHSPHLFLKQGLSPTPKFISSTRLAGQQTSGISSLCFLRYGLEAYVARITFPVDTRDSSLDMHTSTASVLINELPPFPSPVFHPWCRAVSPRLIFQGVLLQSHDLVVAPPNREAELLYT